jgi:phosphate-selective porin
MHPKIPTLAAVLLALSLSSTASADRTVGNLKGFVAKDVCALFASFTVDDTEDKTQSAKLEKTLEEQDLLFDTKFTNNPFTTCSQFIMITFDSLKLDNGNYAYMYEIQMYAKDGEIKSLVGTAKIKYPSYYTVSGFGSRNSLSSLQEYSIQKTKELFQYLALDWRKAHQP